MILDGTHYDRFHGEADHVEAEDPKHPLTHRLIVALDMPQAAEASALVGRLGDSVQYYKVGLELLFGGGLKLAQQLLDDGKWVFLDMKMSDIGNTIEKAVANVARIGVNYLTIHGTDSKTLNAAVQGRGDSDLGLLAVTVLTNLNSDDLREQGISEGPAELALRRARMAYSAGFNGVIASAHEAAAIRKATALTLKGSPERFVIKTPGIRPSGTPVGDQFRVMTPKEAIAAGADYLVVGRPITQARDPKRVATQILEEITGQLRQAKRLGRGIN